MEGVITDAGSAEPIAGVWEDGDGLSFPEPAPKDIFMTIEEAIGQSPSQQFSTFQLNLQSTKNLKNYICRFPQERSDLELPEPIVCQREAEEEKEPEVLTAQQRKKRAIFVDHSEVADRNRRRELGKKWELNAGNGETEYEGNFEGGLSANYCLFQVLNDGTVRVTPVDEWYNFKKVQKNNILSVDEAEAIMKAASRNKKAMEDWLAGQIKASRESMAGYESQHVEVNEASTTPLARPKAQSITQLTQTVLVKSQKEEDAILSDDEVNDEDLFGDSDAVSEPSDTEFSKIRTEMKKEKKFKKTKSSKAEQSSGSESEEAEADFDALFDDNEEEDKQIKEESSNLNRNALKYSKRIESFEKDGKFDVDNSDSEMDEFEDLDAQLRNNYKDEDLPDVPCEDSSKKKNLKSARRNETPPPTADKRAKTIQNINPNWPTREMFQEVLGDTSMPSKKILKVFRNKKYFTNQKDFQDAMKFFCSKNKTESGILWFLRPI